MNLNQDQIQRFINKVFDSNQSLVLDKAELELLQKMLFSRTREFQQTYIGSGNVIENIGIAVQNKLHENDKGFEPLNRDSSKCERFQDVFSK